MNQSSLKKLVLFLVLIVPSIIASINTSATDIKGKVRNPGLIPLENAHVLLLNTPFGTTSDSLGNFHFSGLTDGDYKIQISFLGYETLIRQIEVKSSKSSYEFILHPGTIELQQGTIVSATRFQTQKFTSPFSIESINEEELKEDIPRTTPEALVSHGAWVQKTNHGGGSPFVRGLTGYHTLLMVDGIRLNNATFRSGPNQYLNTLDPLILSNIEIIRSTGSVQYGSDALGGTVHFFTKTPQFSDNGKVLFKPRIIARYVSQGLNGIHNTVSGSLFPGMEQTTRGEASISGKNIAFYGGFGYKNFNDIDASAELGTLEPNAYDEYDADAKLIFRHKRHKFTTAFQLVKQNNVPLYHKIVTGTYSRYHFDPQYRSLIYLKHEFHIGHRWARKINTTLYSQYSLEERQKQKTGESIEVLESDKVRSTGASINLFSAPTKRWTFTSGLDYNFDRVNSFTRTSNPETREVLYSRGLYSDNSSAWNMALFTLHQFTLEKLVINAGVRYNSFHIATTDSIFGSTSLTPSALVGNFGLSYEINENFRLTSMLNSGFRAPNINDVSSFGIADFRYEIPSSNLKPEKSLSYEFGFRQKSSRISSSFSIFRTGLTNLITNELTTYQGADSVLINSETGDYIHYYKKENTSKACIWGFEAEAELQLFHWLNSYGRLYYTFGQDLPGKEALRRIPPVNGTMGFKFYPGEKTNIRMAYLFAGMQDRLSSGDMADDRIPEGGTPGWHLINISASYTGIPFLDINMGIRNLFDTAYRTHGSGVDGYGRNIWIGIELHFND